MMGYMDGIKFKQLKRLSKHVLSIILIFIIIYTSLSTEFEVFGQTITSISVDYVAVGPNNVMVIADDGTVKGFGLNTSYELGMGTATNMLVPSPINNLSGVVQLASGANHTLALMSDGTVRAWGQNSNYQLGLNNTTEKQTPTVVTGLTNVKQVVAGNMFSLALLQDGSVKAWGINNCGQLGLGNTITQTIPCTVPSLSGVKQLVAGYDFAYALMTDGRVAVWGNNANGQLGLGDKTIRRSPVINYALTGVKQLIAGYTVGLALLENSTVMAWGYNNDGQLGLGNTTETTIPLQVALSGVTRLAAGYNHAFALLEDGTVKAWGQNTYGQLGDGTTSNRTSPVLLSALSNIQGIYAGEKHSIAFSEDKIVYSWGANSSGQLGLNDTTQRNTPTLIANLKVAVKEPHLSIIAPLANSTLSEADKTFIPKIAVRDAEKGSLTCMMYIDSETTPRGTKIATVIPGSETDVEVAFDPVSIGILSYGKHTIKFTVNNGIASSQSTVNFIINKAVSPGSIDIHPGTDNLTVIGTTTDGYPGLTSKPYRVTVTKGETTVDDSGWYSESSNPIAASSTVINSAYSTAGNGGRKLVKLSNGYLVAGVGIGSTYIRFYISKDNGNTWNYLAYRSSGTANGLALAAMGNTVCYLTISGTTVTFGQIDNLTTSGQNVTSTENLLDTQTSVGLCSLDVSEDGHLHAVWSAKGSPYTNSYNLRYSESTDRGSTWNTCWVTTQNTSGSNWTMPCVVARENKPIIFACFTTSTSKALKYLLNNGTTWNPEKSICDVDSTNPCVVVDNNGIIHLVWEGYLDSSSSVKNIWYTSLNNDILYNGQQSSIVNLTNEPTYSQTGPSITADNNNHIFVLWQGIDSSVNTSYTQIRMLECKSTLGPITNLTSNTSGNSSNPSVCINPGFSSPLYVSNYASTLKYSGSVNTGISYTTHNLLTSNTLYHVNFEIKNISSSIQSSSKDIYTLADEPIIQCDWSQPDSVKITVSDNNPAETEYQVMYGKQYVNELGKLVPNEIWIKLSGKIITVNNLPDQTDRVVKIKAKNGDGLETDFVTSGIDTTSSKDFIKIACGSNHTLALKNDGTVWAWGRNNAGQLGDGTTADRSKPVQVAGLRDIIAIAGGEEHSIALKKDGTVWTWGNNIFGQLGDCTTTDRNTPVQVKGLSGVTAITGGYNHTVAIKSDGTAWTWGNNLYGQLGDGTTTNRSTPVQVTGLNGVTAIAGGCFHTIALKNDGSVWTWGGNGGGQLGDGTYTDRSNPVQVTSISGVAAIAAGRYSTKALKKDGTVWELGAIGPTPVQITQLSSTGMIACGGSHSLALIADGTLWAWGLNNYGQLGNGTTTNNSTPIKVTDLNDVKVIACGYSHTVALKNDGTIWAWGDNRYGQLGNGTTVDSKFAINIFEKPNSPSIVITSVSSHSLSLSWPSIDGSVSYDIERNGRIIANTKNPTFVDTKLQPNTEYKYRIRAIAVNDCGDWSQEVTKYTLANVPIKNTITLSNDGSIKASWNPNGNPINTEYSLAAFDLSCQDDQGITNPWKAGLSDTLVGLHHSHLYAIKVKAKNGESSEVVTEWCDLGLAMPTPSVPIVTTERFGTLIQINWPKVEGAVWYDLEVDGKVIEKASVTKDDYDNYSYKHTGLKPLSQHTYRVRARNISGAGEWSNLLIVSTTTGIPTVAPKLRSRSTNTTITLSWTDVPDAEFYYIKEVIDGKNKTILENYPNTTCEIRGLTPGSTHEYMVCGKNSLPTSEDQSDEQLAWGVITITTELLDTPSNIIYTESDDSITFKWDPVIGANTYSVKIGTGELDNSITDIPYEDIPYKDIPHDTYTGITETTYTVSGLSENTRITYSIQAVNDSGESAWSLEAPAFTLPTKPSVPENVSATVTDKSIIISWNDVFSGDDSWLRELEGYDVELDGVILENDNKTFYVHDELEPYSRHTYRVRARNLSVAGDWSPMQSIRTLPGKPIAPSGITVVSTQTGATISWLPEPGATGYDIQIIDGTTTTFEFNIQKTSFTHHKAAPGKECRYRVRTNNSVGPSLWSGEIINNALKANCKKKVNVDLGLTATDITDFSPYTMVVTYNPGVIDVIDLCTQTGTLETKAGKIDGTGIEIIEFTPGRIVFKVDKVIEPGQAWTGVINSIKFKARETGGTTITYTVLCKPEVEE